VRLVAIGFVKRSIGRSDCRGCSTPLHTPTPETKPPAPPPPPARTHMLWFAHCHDCRLLIVIDATSWIHSV